MQDRRHQAGSWDYIDFPVEISRVDTGGDSGASEASTVTYQVRVRSEVGNADRTVRFPVSDTYKLQNGALRVENTISFSASPEWRSSPQDEGTVERFGQELFEMLFSGEVKVRYSMGLGQARQQGKKGLRLKLHVDAPELAKLPWEFLYDATRHEYLGLSARTPLVRYLDTSDSIEPLTVKAPLKILVMVANPEGLSQLNVERERENLERATRDLQKDGLVELTWLEESTWSALMHKLWNDTYHIFHFIGHGAFGSDSNEGSIAFAHDDGTPYLLPASRLADLLSNNNDLRLVFLNSCEGARGSEGNAVSSAAEVLVKRGVPAVLAMQYKISDDAAIAFAQNFYEAVAARIPVDAAVTQARVAVRMGSAVEWGTPVLFMRSPDGRLFDIDDVGPDPVDPETRYADSVESEWADRKMTADRVHWLESRRISLGLDPEAARRIERAVMGATKEDLLRPEPPPPPPPPPGIWERIVSMPRRKKVWLIGAALVVLILIAAALPIMRGLGFFDPASDIEAQVRGHYEAIERGDLHAAYDYFSSRAPEFAGVEQQWIQGLEVCRVKSNAVTNLEVFGIDGDQATASLDYKTTDECGVENHFGITWGMVIQDGEWKLNGQVDGQLLYSSQPQAVLNTGEKESLVAGDTELEHLEVVSASNTAADGADAESFEPAKAVDGLEDTAWMVGGEIKDEWLLLQFDEAVTVRRVGLIPGYDKKDSSSGTDRFYQMHVIKSARLELKKGSEVVKSEVKSFEREREVQYLDFEDIEADSVRITILETYPPESDPDKYPLTYAKAAISEVEVIEP
jgi:hypothetical protein